MEQVRSATAAVTSENSRYAQTTVRVRNATEQASRSQQGFAQRLASTAARVYVLYMALNSIAKKLAETYKASNDYIENLNLFRVTMRENTEEALKFANSVEKIMGINISEWISYQGKFKQLAAGFGVVNDQADIMSKNLTQLSYDMASFFNVSNEKAFDKLSSAMTGQVKGLREFGIDTSIASLQEYALAKGIDLSVRKMTQAQKAVLRYNYILEKSINIHGDLARTIYTPANALRVLSAQIEQLRRAIGNIISALASKLIPYVQAAVMLLTDWANAIAGDLGFELPTIDYSNLDYAADVTDDISDNFDDVSANVDEATAEIKKLKLQLMGFDELNILKSPTDDSASKLKEAAKTAADYPSDLGLGIPEYDFGLGTVTSQSKEIYKKLKDYFDNLTPAKFVEDLLTFSWDLLLKGVKLFIEGLKGVWNWFTKLDTKSKILVGTIAAIFAIVKIKQFINWIGKIFPSLNGVFGKLQGKFPGFFNGLIQAAGVAVATIMAYFTAHDFFYKLKSDSLDAQSAVVDVFGAMSSLAMGFMMGGWIGLAISAVGLLAGAISGVTQATEEAVKQIGKDAFYDHVGTKISDLADEFNGLMGKIESTYKTYNEKFKKLATSKADIDTTVNNINQIKAAFDNGALSAEQACQTIHNELNNLASQVPANNNAYFNAVYDLLYSPFGKALEDAGIAKSTILSLTGDITGRLNTEAAQIQNKIQKLESDRKSGLISDSQYMTKSKEYSNQLSGLAIMPANEESAELTTLKRNISSFPIANIDFEDESTYKGKFQEIATSVKNAKKQVNDYYDNAVSVWKAFRDKAKTQGEKAKFTQLISVSEQDRNSKLKEIESQLDSFYKQVSVAAVGKMDKVRKDLLSKWDSDGWLQFTHGNKEKWLNEELNDWQTEFLRPLDDEFKSVYTEAGYAFNEVCDRWGAAEQTAISIRRSLKSETDAATDYMSTHAPEAFDKTMNALGTLASTKSADIRNKVQENVKAALTPNVDLSEWEKTGRGMVTSLLKGTMIKATDYGWNANITLKKSALTGPSAMASRFYNYTTRASGGFPDVGEMFIARESGPELVGSINGKTAVANNDQITEGIARAVYSAMMSAKSSGNNKIELHNQITLDGRVVGEQAIEYHNNEVIRTGKSPLRI